MKYKEIFDELSSERICEIYNMSREINFNNLIHYHKHLNLAPINLIDFKGPMHIHNNIKNDEKINQIQ